MNAFALNKRMVLHSHVSRRAPAAIAATAAATAAQCCRACWRAGNNFVRSYDCIHAHVVRLHRHLLNHLCPESQRHQQWRLKAPGLGMLLQGGVQGWGRAGWAGGWAGRQPIADSPATASSSIQHEHITAPYPAGPAGSMGMP